MITIYRHSKRDFAEFLPFKGRIHPSASPEKNTFVTEKNIFVTTNKSGKVSALVYLLDKVIFWSTFENFCHRSVLPGPPATAGRRRHGSAASREMLYVCIMHTCLLGVGFRIFRSGLRPWTCTSLKRDLRIDLLRRNETCNHVIAETRHVVLRACTSLALQRLILYVYKLYVVYVYNLHALSASSCMHMYVAHVYVVYVYELLQACMRLIPYVCVCCICKCLYMSERRESIYVYMSGRRRKCMYVHTYIHIHAYISTYISASESRNPTDPKEKRDLWGEEDPKP
jgi:hypothetical protein